MVKVIRNERTDPEWPTAADGQSPVSELAASVQGAQSPFGEVVFPVPPEELPYVHPVTRINR